MSFILSQLYIKYGRSLSNRKLFAQNLMMLTMTTMLIITIVKSSLALSLGLVGALSIVRFRTALKEPEELTVAFLAIAIGLGLGAGQVKVTCVGVLIIGVLMLVKNKLFEESSAQHLHLVLSSNKPNTINIDDVINVLSEHSELINLKRLSEDAGHIESAISIDIKSYKELIALKQVMKKRFPTLAVNFIDNSGILTS